MDVPLYEVLRPLDRERVEPVSCLDLCANHVRLFLLGVIVATCGLISVETSELDEKGTDDPGPVCLIRLCQLAKLYTQAQLSPVHAPIAIARAWPNPSGTLSTMRSSLLRNLDMVEVEDVVVNEQGDSGFKRCAGDSNSRRSMDTGQ